MDAMNPQLAVLLDNLLDGKILQKGMFRYLDLDQALDKRDGEDFEKEYMPVDEALERLKKANPLTKNEMKKVDEIREAAFKNSFNLTKHDEVSGYISDDFGLIATALILGVQDPWLNGLWMAYRQGRFPTGAIERVEGKLDSLIP